MDNIFDSWIYIVITIVAFVISTIGKKKKKKTGVPPFINENNGPKKKPFLSNLEQLLKEEMGIVQDDYQNEYISNPIEEQKEEVLDTVPKEMLDDKEDIPYSIEYEDTSEIFANSIEKKDITNEEEDLILKDFNLRDAIIYSEIINRKEY